MELPRFRELCMSVFLYEGKNLYREVLLPWKDNAKQIMVTFANYRDVEAKYRPEEHQDNLFNWYALSRISDWLLSQPHLIEPTEYLQFFSDLGMHTFDQSNYHPFYHEIVEVEQTENPDEPISLVKVLWPGLLFGQMLFSRAGVKVRGGERFINKTVAEKSLLYFAFMRRNRPVRDLSQWSCPRKKE